MKRIVLWIVVHETTIQLSHAMSLAVEKLKNRDEDLLASRVWVERESLLDFEM